MKERRKIKTRKGGRNIMRIKERLSVKVKEKKEREIQPVKGRNNEMIRKGEKKKEIKGKR